MKSLFLNICISALTLGSAFGMQAEEDPQRIITDIIKKYDGKQFNDILDIPAKTREEERENFTTALKTKYQLPIQEIMYGKLKIEGSKILEETTAKATEQEKNIWNKVFNCIIYTNRDFKDSGRTYNPYSM